MRSPLNVETPHPDSKAIDLGHRIVLAARFAISTFPDFSVKCCLERGATSRKPLAKTHITLRLQNAPLDHLKISRTTR